MPDSDRVAAILRSASELPEAERAAYVRAEAGEDEALARRVLDLLDQGSEATVNPEAGGSGAEAPGAPEPRGAIGPYTILSLLGRGGMGEVFLAEQQRPRRRVALKVIRGGLASPSALRRFEFEAEVLGRLKHPGIAQVYEAGVHEGAPFFAMEFVEGELLTDYANRHKLGTRARLGLFAKICEAVHHAHTRGVIHRDLKPANILVTRVGEPPEAQPKILDFGVARATDADIRTTTLQTDIGQLVGTVPYMSPEQVAGDPLELDTRSDVYALGVVLYELLAGRLPYELKDRMVHEACRVIREDEPARLSVINTRLRGDIETIVGKALEKDRDRRYQSALELGSDIDRYLGDEPISARPPSALYQFRKFSRRNRSVVVGVGAVFVALTVGLAGTTYGQIEANALRRLANKRADEAGLARNDALAAQAAEAQRADELEQVVAFQEVQLGGVDPDGMGLTLRDGLRARLGALAERRGLDDEAASAFLADHDSSVAGADFTGLALEALEREVFEPALGAIDDGFADQPLVRARLLQAVASTMAGAGLLDAAARPQQQALAIRRTELGNEHPDTLASVDAAGSLIESLGNLVDAEPLYREALAGRRRGLGEDHIDTIRSMNNMGYLLIAQGELAAAEPYYREALADARRTLGDDHPVTLGSINNMGALLVEQGKPAAAEPYYREALAGHRRVLGDDHPDTLVSINSVGTLLSARGDQAGAEPYFRESLESSRRVLGDDHPDTLISINNLGYLLGELGDLDGAELLYREALDRRRRVLGDDHPDTLISINNMGTLLYFQGRLAEAEPYFVEVVETERRVLGPDHPDTLVSLNNIGSLLIGQGKLAEAEPYFKQALEASRRTLGPDHPKTLTLVSNVGVLLDLQGKAAESEPFFREALETRRRVSGDDDPATLVLLDKVATVVQGLGRFDEADALGAEAVERGRAAFADEPWRLGLFLAHHARTLVALERFAESEAAAVEAFGILEPSPDVDPEETVIVAAQLADLYDAWHAVEPGAGHDIEAADWRAKLEAMSSEDSPAPPTGRGGG